MSLLSPRHVIQHDDINASGHARSGRDYFAGLKVTKRDKGTVLLRLTLLQTPTLTLTRILTLTLT